MQELNVPIWIIGTSIMVELVTLTILILAISTNNTLKKGIVKLQMELAIVEDNYRECKNVISRQLNQLRKKEELLKICQKEVSSYRNSESKTEITKEEPKNVKVGKSIPSDRPVDKRIDKIPVKSTRPKGTL